MLSKELFEVTIVCVHTPFQSFFATDLSPCCTSIQPMSQQRAHPAGTDIMHAMLFHCI